MTTEQMVDNEVGITYPAQLAYEAARAHIAKCWRELDDGTTETREKLEAMDRSLHSNISHLIMARQHYDGQLQFQSDGVPENMSFFWIYKKSGYHGGLIFHRTHVDGKPTEIGTWSIHT